MIRLSGPAAGTLTTLTARSAQAAYSDAGSVAIRAGLSLDDGLVTGLVTQLHRRGRRRSTFMAAQRSSRRWRHLSQPVSGQPAGEYTRRAFEGKLDLAEAEGSQTRGHEKPRPAP
jgi:hypothetical protein